MDPLRGALDLPETYRQRFPRVRGDGPCSRWKPRVYSLHVSPACAGMDPSLCLCATEDVILFPPRARGWTPADIGRWQSRRRGVSPACAGMDPAVAAPHILASPSNKVSPACAGMDPSSGATRMAITRLCFPRVRGDGPERSRPDGKTVEVVSPACAGMDPVLCQNSAQPASTKELRLSHSGETLAREQVTRRPPTFDCGNTHRWSGCVSLIIYSRHPEHQRGHRPAQGLLLRLHRYPAVIRPRALRDRRDGHGLYAVGGGCPDSSIG